MICSNDRTKPLIVKRNFAPLTVLRYVAGPLGYATAVAVAVAVVDWVFDARRLGVPFAPVGTLGAAVAIFAAFRINAAYARWWEGRAQWAAIHNAARVLARQLVAATDDAVAAGNADASAAKSYAREQVLRLAAFANALRGELRGVDAVPTVAALLPPDEHARLSTTHNVANQLLQTESVRIKDGVRSGLVGQFDPISLEPNLGALNAAMAACERLQSTPTPRQYDYFTRVGVAAFTTLLPFALLGSLPTGSGGWLVPLSVMIGGTFIVLERVGAVLDAPFANTVNDVPLDAICVDIERDLRAQLGDNDLPAPVPVVAGYLW